MAGQQACVVGDERKVAEDLRSREGACVRAGARAGARTVSICRALMARTGAVATVADPCDTGCRNGLCRRSCWMAGTFGAFSTSSSRTLPDVSAAARRRASVCVCVCVRACVRARVRVFARVCACAHTHRRCCADR